VQLSFLFCTVSEQLPIALVPADIEHNPELGKLLKALTQHILPTGALSTGEEDLREVSAACLLKWVVLNDVDDVNSEDNDNEV